MAEKGIAAIQKRQRPASWIIGWGFTLLVLLLCLILVPIYLIGDISPLGETITIFPPVTWAIFLLAIATPTLLSRLWRAVITALASIIGFLLITEDVRSLSRAPVSQRIKAGNRIITWNIAGRSDMSQLLIELEPLQPDLVFLQETPDGEATLSTATLSGYWRNFDWLDTGDCGILSRYPLSREAATSIGPWDKPGIATVEIPDNHGANIPVLLCNVRMMLPMITTDPIRWITESDARSQSHRQRLDQYIKLANLLSENRGSKAGILAGDFNVRGGSVSLKPLQSAGYTDAWRTSGHGWGGTVLADFPMARIDQVWISDDLDAVHSQTSTGQVSDHKMVICDFRFKE